MRLISPSRSVCDNLSSAIVLRYQYFLVYAPMIFFSIRYIYSLFNDRPVCRIKTEKVKMHVLISFLSGQNEWSSLISKKVYYDFDLDEGSSDDLVIVWDDDPQSFCCVFCKNLKIQRYYTQMDHVQYWCACDKVKTSFFYMFRPEWRVALLGLSLLFSSIEEKACVRRFYYICQILIFTRLPSKGCPEGSCVRASVVEPGVPDCNLD